MATATPRRHPDRERQTANRYPFRVQIGRLNPDGSKAPILELPCAYNAALGSMPDPFQDEAESMDRILLPEWRADVTAKQEAVVFVGTLRKRFVIADVCPQGPGPNQTLLLVTPKN